MVAITPARQAQQVPSNQDVSIRFDHDMDEASVGGRFTVTPRTTGSLLWPSRRQLIYRHQPFKPDTDYRVSLVAGYRDAAGNANSFNHGWTFRTESAPELAGSSPGAGEQNVDPAATLSLTFSRAMDLRSLAGAVSVSPSIRFSLRADPGDSRRVLLAPESLLDPQTVYSVTVTRDALDLDGNPIRAGSVRDFATGPARPLRHWVTFLADQAPSSPGSATGIWMVDANRLPRQLADLDATAFSWSLDGTRLLVQTRAGPWLDVALGGATTRLPFDASWAAFLGPGEGYVFLSAGRLQRLKADGEVVSVDSGVGEVTVAPNGERIAYTVAARAGDEIRGYEVDLRARYRIQAEAGAVSSLAWSPDGARIAYQVATSDPSRRQLRVRELSGVGGLTTVRTGDLTSLAWQADSRHLIVGANVDGPSGPGTRAFRLALTDISTRPLAWEEALPAGNLVDVESPVPSPDGHQVAFVGSGPASTGAQIWVVNVDGTGLVALTSFDAASFPYSVRAPAWTVS